MNPKVDFYFAKAEKWQEEIITLRKFILACGLTEELKWGVPCYTFQKNNIVLIHVFKEYCKVSFFKGAQLNDTNGMLVQQTENVQGARQIRFTNMKEVNERETILKTYIFEAIEVEKVGLKVELKKTSEFDTPDEFQKKLNEDPDLKSDFESLTTGRQRGYLLFFSAPKQSHTRALRIEKSIPKILIGKGIND